MAGPKETRSAIVYVAKLPLITTKLEPLTVLTRRRVISRPWTDVMAKAMFRIRLYTRSTASHNITLSSRFCHFYIINKNRKSLSCSFVSHRSVIRYIQQQETKSESKNHSLQTTTIQPSLERSRKHYSTCIAFQCSIFETFILLHSS